MKNILSLSTAKLIALSILLFSGLFFFLSSCSDAELTELKTDKGDVLFDTRYTDTTTIVLQTIREDSIRSDEFSQDLIGAYYDNTVGKLIASSYFEVRLPSTEVTFETSDVYRSVELSIKYSGTGEYFGDTTEDLTLRVYQLTQRIYLDSSYYSTSSIEYSSTEIGQYTGKITPWSDGSLVIKLDDDFGQMLFNESPSPYEDSDDFLEFMKGIAIVPDDPLNKGWVGHFVLEDDSTYLSLNYNDTSSYKFPVNSLCARISNFKQDFTGTVIEQQLNNSNQEYDQVFLKPLAGVKIKVHLPYFKNYVDSGNIAIHKAEMVFTPDESSAYYDLKPSTLLLLDSDEDDKNVAIIDRYEDHYGGEYIDDDEAFSVIITRYLQQLLTSYASDPDFDEHYGMNLIIPSDNPITAVPLILLQKDLSGKQVAKLKLHYTRP